MNKIDVTIKMFEDMNYDEAYGKLRDDIAPKLAEPRPTPRTSWLYLYPEGSAEQKLVSSFAAQCQKIIEYTRLVDPRPP